MGRGLSQGERLKLEKYQECTYQPDVPDFYDALSIADLFVLWTNYPVGVRTRLAVALSVGTPCAVSTDVLGNMPELAECDAVIALHDIRDLGSVFGMLAHGRRLMGMRDAALSCYEASYSPAAAQVLLDRLESCQKLR